MRADEQRGDLKARRRKKRERRSVDLGEIQHFSPRRADICGYEQAACVAGDLLVTVPPESQSHRSIIRKSASERVIAIEPLGDGVRVKTEATTIDAGCAIVAAGGWASSLLPRRAPHFSTCLHRDCATDTGVR